MVYIFVHYDNFCGFHDLLNVCQLNSNKAMIHFLIITFLTNLINHFIILSKIIDLKVYYLNNLSPFH